MMQNLGFFILLFMLLRFSVCLSVCVRVCVCMCVCVAACVLTMRVECRGTSQKRGQLLGDGMCWIRQRSVPPSL